MTERRPAIVIGAHANGTGVIRSLGRCRIPVYAVQTLRSDMGHYSKYVKQSFSLLEIASDPDVLVDFLESHLDLWKGAVLIPTNDHALTGMAKNHARLSENFRLTCPPWEIVERVIDKSQTVASAREVGIAVPEVYGKATADFQGASELDYPVLVKPIQGHQFAHVFNKKLFQVENAEELAGVIAMVEAEGFDCEIVEFVVGPETAIQHFQVFIDANGAPRGAFTYRKLRQEPPVFGVARACETYDAPELHDLTLALLERIEWRGIASVAFKQDIRNGRHYLMEINGRSPLSHGLALKAGHNYALMAYCEAAGQEMEGDNPNGWQGVWIHLHADFFSTVKSLRRDDFSFRELLASYRRPKTFAVWSRDDPKPFVQQWWWSLKKTPRWLVTQASKIGAFARDERGSFPGRLLEQTGADCAQGDAALSASLARRTRFADSCRLGIDRIRMKLRLPRRMAEIQWGYYGAVTAFDIIEALRTLGPVPSPGRPHAAALASSARLDQTPEYRAYWYDRDKHALVGTLVGLDLHRFNGRYYALECNLTAGLMPERRVLYSEDIDPFIVGLAEMAKRQKFKKIVLHRRSWRTEHLREFEAAAKAYDIEIMPCSAMHETGDPLVNPMIGLPRDLERDTLYVVSTALSESATFQFLHQKSQFDRWLPEALDRRVAKGGRLAPVPGGRGPEVPVLTDDPRWPNLVVKLANSDEGRDILFGRFTSPVAARRALGLSADGAGVPRQFLRGPVRNIAQRVFPHALSAVFQSFVPPEDEDGYPKMMRMEAFISPLEDLFLSAHGTVGGELIPTSMPVDQPVMKSPLNVSVPPGRFVRLDPGTEAELADVAQEFGGCARAAISGRFHIVPDD
ncbi:hypothetical protein KX928_15415 [Roseobacter sp. YSTF-M11]|uniref:ATP-grasp domain-containing protein n=1 Tax=Roseobacter insulae TaxID=2859783 RepID=A0A9X1FY53_9RHOB|nr:hypothetical protein [Roseobacter insulae]MBW4709180.1 hypothetical protein [Roseobacter insulae]